MAEPDDGSEDGSGFLEYELDDEPYDGRHLDGGHLDGGDDGVSPPPALPVGILLGALAALGLLVLALVLFGLPGDWAGTTSRPAVPPDASAPGPPLPVQTASPRTGVDPGRLSVTDVNGAREFLPRSQSGLSVVSLCSPQTDGAGRLTVGLQVVNTGPTTVRLLAVRPRLRSGLVRLEGVRAGGSCGEPGEGDLALDLAPSGRVLVTMELQVLDPCPGSVPVGVRVRAQYADGARTVSFPLFADLGSVVFAGC